MKIENLRKLLQEGTPEAKADRLIEALSPEQKMAVAQNEVIKKSQKVNQNKAEEELAKAKRYKNQADLNIARTEFNATNDPLAIIPKGVKDTFANRPKEVAASPNATISEKIELIQDDTIVPFDPSGSTMVKFGSTSPEVTSTGKQSLEPTIKAPDPDIDPEFDGPADPQSGQADVEIAVKINKEDDNMEKEPKIIIAESIKGIFRILKEESEQPQAEVVPTAEVDEQPAVEAAPAEDVAVVAPEQTEVLVTDGSIRVEIPLASEESMVQELPQEANDVLQEAFRIVYSVLTSKSLKEEESAEIPADAEAEVKVEGGKLVIEIPTTEAPKDQITPEENEALQEALTVIASLLKEELGDAAAEPVATSEEAPQEKSPELENDDVYPAENHQQAEEVEEVIVQESEDKLEVSKPEEQQYEVAEIAKQHAEEPAVTTSVKSGEVVVDAHDHADAEGKQVRDAIIQEEETIEIPEDVEAEVLVGDSSIRIEIPSANNSGELEVSEEDQIGLQEAFKFIYGLFYGKPLNEGETVEVPEGVEADVNIHDGKLVIEIPVESPKESISDEEATSLQEMINFASFVLLEAQGTNISNKDTLADAGKKAAYLGGAAGAAATAGAVGQNLVKQNWQVAADAIKRSMPSARSMTRGAWERLFQQRLADAGLATSADAAVLTGLPGVGQTVSALATGAGELVSGAAAAIGGLSAPFLMGALGISAAAAAAMLGTASGRKFLAQKFGLGKTGKAYKELEGRRQEDLNKSDFEVTNALAKNKEKYIKDIATMNAKETMAKRGLTLGAKLASKLGVGNFNVFGWKPFQNQRIQDKMASGRETLIKDLTDPSGERFKRLDAQGFKFDPKTGRVVKRDTGAFDYKDKANLDSDYEISRDLKSTTDYNQMVRSVAQNAKSLAAANKEAARKAREQLDKDNEEKEIEKEQIKLLKKDKDMQDLEFEKARAQAALPNKAVAEGVDFDADAAYSLLEGTVFSEEEKLNIVADAYGIIFYENLRESILESGYLANLTGVSKYLLENGQTSITEEEKKDIVDAINSEEVVKSFEDSHKSIRSSEIENNEVSNKDRLEKSEKKVDVEPVIFKESVKLPEPGDSVEKQYDIDAANKVGMNVAKAEKEAEIVEDKAEAKAQPEDVTDKKSPAPGKEAEYDSLRDAFLLEADYFEKESVSVVTPEAKQNKLVNQISLLVARDSADPLYEELLHSTAVAKELQVELHEKYKAVAKKKADQLLKAKSKKSEATQASSLISEGVMDWIKGKLILASIKFLSDQTLNSIIMKAHTKAMGMAKNASERNAIAEVFTTTFPDKKSKIEFIKMLIKNAPKDLLAKAEEKAKSMAAAEEAKNPNLLKPAGQLSEFIEPVTATLGAIGAFFSSQLFLGMLVGLVLAGVAATVEGIVRRISDFISNNSPYKV